jgi:hypothetical protein
MKTLELDPSWAPYEPTREAPWDVRRIVHLHRRAGFAATWSEIRRDLADGPKAALDRVLSGKTREKVPAGFDALTERLAEAAVAGSDGNRLKAWWVYRMLFGPDPLAERLALCWHNHFATSQEKVRNLEAMRRQNEDFRTLGRGPFGKLLHRALREPALLVWLDAPANRKGKPNENLGRELMELFTLGIGPYTEADVKEAARALTGWTVADGKFQEDESRHDDGEKTVLGKTGKYHGGDLLDLLLARPETSRRLVWRLGNLFFGENAVSDRALDSLAEGLRAHDLDLGWAVETMLRSRGFFADANLGTQVLGPAEHVVGSARALELFDPPPSTLALADWIARLGQSLFFPPNVFGWPGGRAWVTPRAMVRRSGYAAALVEGEVVGRPAFDAVALARKHDRARDLDDLAGFYLELLQGRELSDSWKARLRSGLGDRPPFDTETARRVVILILSSPEAQLA